MYRSVANIVQRKTYFNSWPGLANITVWWSYSNLRYPMKLTKFSVTILKPFIFFCQFMIVRVKVTSYLDSYLFKSLVCFSTISWSCMPSLSSFILQRLNFTCGSLITRNWGKRKRKNWTYLRISSQRFWYSSNVIPCNRTNGFKLAAVTFIRHR